MIPAGITEYYLGAGTEYRPHVGATVRAHFVDSKAGLDAWETYSYLAPMLDDGSGPDWTQATVLAGGNDELQTASAPGASFSDVPAALLRPQNYLAWSKQLSEYVYRTAVLPVFRCPLLKINAAPGGSEGDFRARIALSLRERRDTGIDKLRKKYAPKLATLQGQIRRGEERIAREKAQLSDQKMSTAISVGTTLLGALLGRKAISATSVGRAGSAARGAGRVAREKAEVVRAEENLEVLTRRLADLENELDQEIGRLQGELDPAAVEIETVNIKPRKTDISVSPTVLVWVAS